MRFEALTDTLRSLGLPAREERTSPPRDLVRRAQSAVAEGLADPDLLVDCIELELDARRAEPSPHLMPFATLPELGVRFALACWRPGESPPAHEHGDWTVTAVVHGTLDVDTYDWASTRATRRLVHKNRFTAYTRQVGHVHGPTIHRPFNPTSRPALTLHLTGPHDGPVLEPEIGPIEGLVSSPPERKPDVLGRARWARYRQYTLSVLAEALAAAGGPRALAALRAIYAAGDAATKHAAVGAMSALDRECAASFARDLEQSALGSDSRIERADDGITLRVEERAGRAELVAGEGPESAVLLRVDARAAVALRYLAERRACVVAEIPGALALPDRCSLARVLIDWQIFRLAVQRPPSEMGGTA